MRRAPDPSDRRAPVLTLTKSGFDLMRRAHTERIAMADELFSPLDPRERAMLGTLLDKIIEAGDQATP